MLTNKYMQSLYKLSWLWN